MRYVIVAKDDFDGTSCDDAEDPLVVTEIATELVITRLGLFHAISSGDASINDTIVTIEDRKCLYTNIFDSVITWKEFKEISLSHTDIVLDLLEGNMFYTLSQGYKEVTSQLNLREDGMYNVEIIPTSPICLQYKPFYKFFERDKEFILNFERNDVTDYNISEPFIVLVIRTRRAWSEKNMTREFWTEMVEKLKDNNIKTLIFGKEVEEYCDSDLVKHIKTYQDWCSIVESQNCKHIISTMSGGVYPAMIFGNKDIKLTIIDNTGLMGKHSDDPSFYNDCVNFSGVEFEFIDYIPKIEELYERVRKYI